MPCQTCFNVNCQCFNCIFSVSMWLVFNDIQKRAIFSVQTNIICNNYTRKLVGGMRLNVPSDFLSQHRSPQCYKLAHNMPWYVFIWLGSCLVWCTGVLIVIHPSAFYISMQTKRNNPDSVNQRCEHLSCAVSGRVCHYLQHNVRTSGIWCHQTQLPAGAAVEVMERTWPRPCRPGAQWRSFGGRRRKERRRLGQWKKVRAIWGKWVDLTPGSSTLTVLFTHVLNSDRRRRQEWLACVEQT